MIDEAVWCDDPAEKAGPHRIVTTADLHRSGLSARAIRRAVSSGGLFRAHRGTYLHAGAPASVTAAVELAGRVTCVSALDLFGVFAHGGGHHIHFESGAAPRRAGGRSDEVWHWQRLARAPHPRAAVVDPIDALIQATCCQSAFAAVASLDSALHLRLIGQDDLDEIFDNVAPRRRVLRGCLDPRAESGPESIVRMIARGLGFRVEPQVRIPGVGRVDMVLDGWLVVECDSRAFHEGWAAQRHDRRRDAALAAHGLVCVRPIAEDILYHPELVVRMLRGMRDHHR